MRQRYELLDFSTNMPIRCTMQHIGNIEPHLHDFFEVILILSGQCRFTGDGQLSTLGPEDVVAVNSHTPHELHSADCVLISVQFRQSMFEQTLPMPQHPQFICNSARQGDSAAFAAIRRLIARLVKNNADRQQGYELRNWSLIYELMDVMYNNFRADADSPQALRNYRYAARIGHITAIINDHYAENFTLSQLAEKVHLSAPYLSKFFDQHFGMSFLAYLTQLRLGRAVAALESTDDTIEVISIQSGFPNSHAFVQAFKKEYGVLPSVYRRQSRLAETDAASPVPVVEQHDYMAGLKKYLDAPAAGLVPEQVISCTARCSGKGDLQKLRHSWRTLTGVSAARDLLFAQVQDMVRRAQRDIGFQYIKFGGILSDEMRVYSEDPSGTPVYSFAYVDKLFDFLQSVGLRPLIQLGFMPRQLAKDPGRRLFNDIVSEPKSIEAWAGLVGAVVRHLLDRYGAEEVRSWLFTVWQQPDTPSTMYGFSDDSAFYAFYRATWLAVKDCDSALRFGTPPTFYIAGTDHVNWYRPFLAWCRDNGCPPDFLDFNFYDTSLSNRGSGRELFGFVRSMTLGEDPNGLANFVTQVVSEAHQEHVSSLPIYLSEWNTSPSQQDLLNDTCFKSCYIVKSILENYDRLDGFGYWSLTDWMGEAPLPKELFFGGLGLFTVSGIPKASYYAFTLLRRLGGTLIGRGEGWFAARQGESWQVLLYNYRHFSHLYAQGERFDMTFTDRYTPFSPEQSLDVHVTLTDMENGEYVVRETVINRQHGSAFDQWVAMGALEPDRPEEYDYLAAASHPAYSKYLAAARRHALDLDAMLDMLEVRLLEISRAPL